MNANFFKNISILLFTSLSLIFSPAFAQTWNKPKPSEVIKIQENLRDKAWNNLNDRQSIHDYVRFSTEIGDYEAAIGILRRILRDFSVDDPEYIRIKYEIGLMCYRMQAYALAVSFWNDILQRPDLPVDTRAHIQDYLPSALKETQQNRLSFSSWSGYRWQSNANAGPRHDLISLFGAPFTIDPGYRKKPDSNFFIQSALDYSIDLENQRQDRLEFQFSGYLTQQRDFSELNVGLADVNVGPRLALASEFWPDATIKPYATASLTALDQHIISNSYGIGTSLSLPFNNGVVLSPAAEWRRGDIRDKIATRNPEEDSWSFSLTGQTPINSWMSWIGKASFQSSNLNLGVSGTRQYGLQTALKIELDPFVGSLTRRWAVSPFLKLEVARYDQIDMTVHPDKLRRDFNWKMGSVIDLPLRHGFGITALAQFERNQSNIANYRNDNWTMMIGPRIQY